MKMRTYGKAMSVAVAAAAVAAMTVASPASAAVTIRVERAYSEIVPEWNTQFTCPTNQVLTGRTHNGDENAWTTYHCSWIFINGEQVRVSIGDWSPGQKESRSSYSAPADQALVGRSHTGDENGTTRYRAATLSWQGRPVRLTATTWSGDHKESKHTFQADYNRVLVGRSHSGDENGKTRYQHALVTFEG
ncbi:hypothetical protein [Streptosporangium saharense]|uniref:Uncharacterized protein n=1 Tax=Streptosporangium saharense TaxID=1706840 RepID=A0A7W7QGM3_9ACTN|nr:hypothetical protein [Streptosporangium saharense]MBB4913225.1 hypothetical protein [Streptosporangium saharense]